MTIGWSRHYRTEPAGVTLIAYLAATPTLAEDISLASSAQYIDGHNADYQAATLARRRNVSTAIMTVARSILFGGIINTYIAAASMINSRVAYLPRRR